MKYSRLLSSLFRLYIAIFCTTYVSPSYCGQSAIPFSLEILSDGQPVLGCARPSCFGWTAISGKAADFARFYRVGKNADGFLRSSDNKGLTLKNTTKFEPQYSICDRAYLSDQCTGDSWVGGIAPSANINASKIKLMCCYYNRLSKSTFQEKAEVRAGQVIRGGELINDSGRQIAFEYISNVQRLFDQNGVVYVVSVKKFACILEPIMPEVKVEPEATQFLIDNIAYTTTSQPKPKQNFNLPETMVQKIASSSVPVVDSSQKGVRIVEHNLTQQKHIVDNNNIIVNQVFKKLSVLSVPQAQVMDDDQSNSAIKKKVLSTPKKIVSESVASLKHTNVNSPPYPYNYNNRAYSSAQTLSPLDPLGWFLSLQEQLNPYISRNYQPQQQTWAPQNLQMQQKDVNQNYQNKNLVNHVNNEVPFQKPVQQIVQTLSPFNLFTLAPIYQPAAPVQQRLQTLSLFPAAQQKNNVNFDVFVTPAQPLFEIPAPEDIENSISPSGRQWIARLAQTFLGYFY